MIVGIARRLCLVMPGLVACAGLAIGMPQGLAWAHSGASEVGVWQGASTPPDLAGRSNAALMYFQTWQSLDEATRDVLHSGDADDATLEKHRDYVDALLRAAETRDCDWGLRYEQGIDLLLPQLRLMRGTARVFRADAERLLEAGGADNQQQAAQRMAALYRLALHLRNDRILISSLVSQAIAALGNATVEQHMRGGKLAASDAQQIVNALRMMPAQDPFGTKEGVTGERDIFIGWLRSKFAGDDAGSAFITHMGSTIPAGDPAAAQVYVMDEQALGDAIDKALPYYDDVLAIWDEPDAVAKLQSLADLAKSGSYGPLATLILPAFESALSADIKIRADTARTLKMLEAYVANNGVLPPEFLPEAEPTSQPTSPTGTRGE